MSKRTIKDPNILHVVSAAIKTGRWHLDNGTKHAQIVHTSGRKVMVAGTPSCPRAHLNLAKHIKHVEQGLPGWGQGNIVSG